MHYWKNEVCRVCKIPGKESSEHIKGSFESLHSGKMTRQKFPWQSDFAARFCPEARQSLCLVFSSFCRQKNVID
jgi:hypothetical protein